MGREPRGWLPRPGWNPPPGGERPAPRSKPGARIRRGPNAVIPPSGRWVTGGGRKPSVALPEDRCEGIGRVDTAELEDDRDRAGSALLRTISTSGRSASAHPVAVAGCRLRATRTCRRIAARVAIAVSTKLKNEGCRPWNDASCCAILISALKIAEEETARLARYFVETDQWHRIYRGEIDVIKGDKRDWKERDIFSSYSKEQ